MRLLSFYPCERGLILVPTLNYKETPKFTLYKFYLESYYALLWIFFTVFSAPFLFMVAGLIIIFLTFKNRRKDDNTLLPTIRSAHQGVEMLQGQVVACGNPFIGPGSGKACVAYRIDTPGPRNTMRNVEMRFKNFFIDDGTERCLVILEEYPDEVTVYFQTEFYGIEENGRVKKAPEEAPTNGIKKLIGAIWHVSRYAVYTESGIYVGTPVYIKGKFITERDPNLLPITKDAVREVLQEWNQDRAEFVKRFDQNGDGKLDKDEVRDAGKAAHDLLVRKRTQEDFDPLEHPEIHTMQGTPGHRLEILYTRSIQANINYYLLKLLGYGLLLVGLGLLSLYGTDYYSNLYAKMQSQLQAKLSVSK